MIKPFPAVRVNGLWWRFTPKAKYYHELMNSLRAMIDDNDSITKTEIIESLLAWNYHIKFVLQVTKWWKEKQKLEALGSPHIFSPDLDNLYKAFTDTVFYKTENNDRAIHTINCSKERGEESYIEFSIILTDIK